MVDTITIYILFALTGLAAYLAQGYLGEIVYFTTKKWRESLLVGAVAVGGGRIGQQIGQRPARNRIVPMDALRIELFAWMDRRYDSG